MSDKPVFHALPRGFQVSDYTIGEVLGFDASGITYLAHNTADRRLLLLKECFPCPFAYRDEATHEVRFTDGGSGDKKAGRKAVDAFVRMAEKIAALDHPNIAKVVRVFRAQGTAYCVMPCLVGLPLDEWADSADLSGYKEVSRVLAPLLRALRYLHDKDMLHLGISPAVIVVKADGEPVLTGFSLAAGQPAAPCGRYAAPEQLPGRGCVGPATDLYALGAVFYRILTGKRPQAAADRVVDDIVTPLHMDKKLVGRYGEALLMGIDRALELEVADRWKSAGKWLRAFDNRMIPEARRHPGTSAKVVPIPLAGPGGAVPARVHRWVYAHGEPDSAPGRHAAPAPVAAPAPRRGRWVFIGGASVLGGLCLLGGYLLGRRNRV